jgi:hypothetical protein
MLMPYHKEQRMLACADLVKQYKLKDNDFLNNIVTGVETWVHHNESKQQSVEW